MADRTGATVDTAVRWCWSARSRCATCGGCAARRTTARDGAVTARVRSGTAPTARRWRSAFRRERRCSARADGEGDLEGRRWELLAAGQRATVARGGCGGKGNKRFATSTRQAPRFAERGLPGEQGWLELRLKLLADVGLVGLPNAGKSSLLSRLTRAAPKVADYPFTTLSPVLGVLDADERQLVLADIPGLIEGASEGAGLGHDFLAHVERTRLLVHVLDVAPELSVGEGADPLANHATIERELAAHDARLAELPRVLALSKCDLLAEGRVYEAVARWRERLGDEVPVIATSSATGAGLEELSASSLRRVTCGRPPARAGRRAQASSTARLRRERSQAGRSRRARRAAPASSNWPSTWCSARPGAAASASSGSGRARSRCAAQGSSACWRATTWTTRTRWRTSRDRLRRIGVLRALEARRLSSGRRDRDRRGASARSSSIRDGK